MICGAAFLGLSVTQASAAAADAATGEVSEIVVTGTRIPIAEPDLDRQAGDHGRQRRDQGPGRDPDGGPHQLPAPGLRSARRSSITNGATGAATINLRGLGAKRTLVLIDSRRK